MAARHKDSDRKGIMQETRQLLLSAAAEEFALHGFDKANVNRIAESAGFSIGTVYNYFPNKRELMFAFMDQTAQLHVDYIVDHVRKEQDVRRRVEVFFQRGFEFVESHLIQAKAIFSVLNGPDQEFKLRIFQGYQVLFQLLRDDILAAGMDQGIFRRVDPQETGNLLMLIYLGTGSQTGPQGQLWLDAAAVSDFVLHSLIKEDQSG
jgi:AcrR family transcriptional regulator